MFTFHRVGWINQQDEEVSGWLCLIETKDQLLAYFQYLSQDIVNIWLDIKDSPEYKEGHCRTTRANVMKYLLNIKMEKEGKHQITMPNAINYIELISTKTIIDIFTQNGSVYVNSAGGCRITHLRNDHKGIDEEIFETCKNKDFVFPTMSEKDIKITRWFGGPHFYITVKGKTVEINGVSKWNTIQAAEEDRAKYLKRNKFRKD